jgi:MFS transporter, DHA1 family, inner membrane transport protein
VLNWRIIYGGLAAGSALAAAGVFLVLPAKLHTARMSLKSWGEVITRPAILILLAATCLQVMGQFTLFPYLAAELRRASLADPPTIALALALYGSAGLFGSIMAARLVGSLGAARVHLISLSAMATGLVAWSILSASLYPAIASVVIWGLGFGAGVSMQQARLISVAPALASASVALNTSVLYLGQAAGTAIGGDLITRNLHSFIGPAGVVFLLTAIASSWCAKRKYGA